MIQKIDAWCAEHGIRCVYFLASSTDARTTMLAEDHGYRFVDIRITLRSRFEDQDPILRTGSMGEVHIRNSVANDVGSLQRIASTSYITSRFYYDPHFPRELCEKLYTTWIKKSCEDYADVVLVATRFDKVEGYVTCHIDDEKLGKIGLIGVAHSSRGLGTGKSLVYSAIEWMSRQGVEKVDVVTQGRNIPAQRLYQICGFTTHQVEYWYHKWYSQ
jgi:ribosomal protein S18 acetylase RimI-like enzyme